MAVSPYHPQDFFRRIDAELLKQYFTQQGILENFDFSQLNKRNIDPLFEAWRELDEKLKDQTEVDFKEIHSMAHKSAHITFLSEAHNQKENLIELFDQYKLETFHNRAFWLFLNRKEQYWKRVKILTRVESIGNRFWKKLRGLEGIPAKTDTDTCNRLKQRLSEYFFAEQARGKSCNIEYLQRIRDNHTEDYFFTYPEDYADSINDWDNGQMKPLTIHPAFELIFFYQQELGTLELYCPALKSNKQIKTCQEIFCQVVLGIDLPEQSKQKSYEISPMLSSDFSFDFSPQETGIKEVFIKELYVEFLRDKQEKVRISADTTNNKNAVYDFLTMIKNSFQPEPPPMNLISAKVRAVFMDDSSKDFTIGCKNSCNLGLTEQDRILKQVLIDSNIQLTQ